MPRHARRDAPNTLHRVMVRGSERTALVRDDPDRADFVSRLTALAEQGALHPPAEGHPFRHASSGLAHPRETAQHAGRR
jgi:hypothetical protein